MKYLTLFVAISALFVLPEPASARTIDDVYREAQAAFDSGDLDTADQLLNQILERQPSYVAAKSLKYRISEKRKTLGKGGPLKAKCDATILSEISFSEMALGDAVKVLGELSANATDGKFRPNFIIPAELRDQKITLELSRAPLSQVLTYMATLTKSRVQYEEFAVVFTARATVSAPVNPPKEEERVLPAPVNPFERR